MTKPTVVLSGIFYPVAILRYFLAALQRRDDINLITAGTFTGDYIPWNGGMRVPDKYVYSPDIDLGKNVRNFPISFVESRIPERVDLWIQVDAGAYLFGSPKCGENVIIATDPHVLNYDAQRGYADRFYCMQTPYMHAGDLYLPYAYDPVFHAPPSPPVDDEFDVALLGLHYAERNTIMNALSDDGLRVHYSIGAAYEDAASIYHRSLTGLNYSSKRDLTARVFELAAMGVCPVVNRVPDIDRFFNDEDMVIVDSPNEAIDRIKALAQDPQKARTIAGRALAAVSGNTWDARIGTVLGGII